MTPPVSAWRGDRTASRRVNESKLSRPSCGSSGRLLTGVRANRYLEVLTEEEFVLLQRARDREPGLELVDEGESFAEAGHEVAWLEDPLVGPALGADLRDARRKASVLRRERVGQDFYRLDGAARQLEIEVASRRVVEAGAAHLQRPGGRRATLDAQAALRPADDARQHGQQRLKIVTRERLDVHLGAGQHVADRHRLQALGRRVAHRDDVDALADECQPHLDEHVVGTATTHRERC